MASELEPVEVVSREAATVAGLATSGAALDTFVKPAASTAVLKEAFNAYQELSRSLLDDSDFQTISGRSFTKKSGFRKLAVAYNVSVQIVERVYERNDAGRIIRAEVIARATAPNGRSMDGLGACDLFEKCCNPATCRNKSKWHDHCTATCDGSKHFSNPQHDLPATASTRATNRACSDLFGMGEVSAEEITNHANFTPDSPPQHEPPSRSTLLKTRIDALLTDQRKALGAWCDSTSTPRVTAEMNEGQLKACEEWVTKAENGEPPTNPEGSQTAPKPNPAPQPDPAPSSPTEPEPGLDGVDAEAVKEVVKAMELRAVREALLTRGLDSGGDGEAVRKRLVIDMLRAKIAETTAPKESE